MTRMSPAVLVSGVVQDGSATDASMQITRRVWKRQLTIRVPPPFSVALHIEQVLLVQMKNEVDRSVDTADGTHESLILDARVYIVSRDVRREAVVQAYLHEDRTKQHGSQVHESMVGIGCIC